MSDKEIPDNEDVRSNYALGCLGDDAVREDLYELCEADFDRWLAAHDAKVKVGVLDEMAKVFDDEAIGDEVLDDRRSPMREAAELVREFRSRLAFMERPLEDP